MMLIFRVILWLCLTSTMALAITWSRPDCPDKCGNVTIPYPFGIGSKCSANPSFTVICQNSTGPPILSGINLQVVNISVHGTVVVQQPVSPMNCSTVQKTATLPISLGGSVFTISARYNSLVILGCRNSLWLLANNNRTVGTCLAFCDANSTDTTCSGVNCCQATIPAGLKELQYVYLSVESNTSGSCGYTFIADRKWLQEGNYKRYDGLRENVLNPFDVEFVSAPLVLEWEFNTPIHDIESICRFSDDFSNGYFSSYYDNEYDYVSSTQYCTCKSGFEGNPYLTGGCSDIDECVLLNAPVVLDQLCLQGSCINTRGSYTCQLRNGNNGASPDKIVFISLGSAFGALILLTGACMSLRAIRKRIKANRKHKFFKRNGGLLLEQQLSSTDNGLEKTKLFSSNELARATDHYNENRILGRGGQGTVYKGMLTDGKIVAVKKSKRVEEGDLEVFINEIVILSQVNHRNVVKLMGCCLETEVPLLVYEFIPNGTLFQHIHEPNEDFPLSWEMRVRIAREVAGALAYLHSAACVPIYHRDIKSVNILLDDKYRAKVADFGTSRSVAIDQTHLTTRVLGTFGYLDPEYFRSSQFTEKSDVYSFGVVVVELLTGEKAVTSTRAESGKSLAMHFMQSMEEYHLFGILDARVLKEGKREDIVSIAELARRCLHLNGKRRPTMKEVAVALEGIQMAKEASVCLQNQDDMIRGESHSIEVSESDDFSSISGSMQFDTITFTPYSPDTERPLLDEP